MLNVLLREQRQVETSIENVMAAIERGVITNTTTKRLKELEARQKELDKQIIMEKSKNAVRVSEEQIRAYYKEALALEAQMLINHLVKEIVMYDDKIKILSKSFSISLRGTVPMKFGAVSFIRGGRRISISRYGTCEISRIDNSEGVEWHLEAPISLTGKRVKKEEPKTNNRLCHVFVLGSYWRRWGNAIHVHNGLSPV